MNNKRIKHFIVTVFLAFLLIIPSVVIADTYSSILSFGDSLTDNGVFGSSNGVTTNTNTLDAFGIQYFTNGPVWVEYLADPSHLNVPLFDMAFGGATTDYDNPAASLSYTGLQWQVDTYKSVYFSVPGDALVTVWAGANDFFQGRQYDTAAANVTSAVQDLADVGGNHFLVPFLPDIGLSPGFLGTPLQGAATLWSQAFNMYLAADLAALASTPGYGDIDYYILDTFTLLGQLIANPDCYGFIDVTTSGGENPPEGYLFWDEVHPTTDAHAYLAYYSMEAIGVPEPTTIVLLVFGLVGLTGVRRRLQQ
ncbi:MAG: PEP-CTERM sorting domain-containing protein [Deltaproteobacteria bacterium]|nr:PEP-CTERM sorting domain-containing protein [Deltaproteobacteria bacterium]MBN2845458.1 PEP-CTERM sorting domain-containing protein [Deltaproteobacteria bacterium]